MIEDLIEDFELAVDHLDWMMANEWSKEFLVSRLMELKSLFRKGAEDLKDIALERNGEN